MSKHTFALLLISRHNILFITMSTATFRSCFFRLRHDVTVCRNQMCTLGITWCRIIACSTCDDNRLIWKRSNLHFADTGGSSGYDALQCVIAKQRPEENFPSIARPVHVVATLFHANLSQCKFINLWWFPDARHLWIKFIVVAPSLLSPNALCKCWKPNQMLHNAARAGGKCSTEIYAGPESFVCGCFLDFCLFLVDFHVSYLTIMLPIQHRRGWWLLILES